MAEMNGRMSMNVSFHQIEQNQETAGIRGDYENNHGMGAKTVQGRSAVSGVFHFDRSSSVVGDQAYRDQKGKTGGLLEEASTYDAQNAKDFMVVMSNTLSDEDYGELVRKGSNPGDYEPEEMVTVIDEIKVTLAQAGVYIAGYTDDLDQNAVREAMGSRTLGSDGYAAAIARALESKDLPVTEKNVKDCYNEMEKATHLTELSDGAKKYLLENGLEPSIHSLYKATYAGAKDASAQPSGYFGAGAEGYLVRKGNPEALSAMEDQMRKIIGEVGLEDNEATMSDARWLLEKGLPLTGENLFRLQKINQIVFPIGAEEAAMAAADALSVGLSAKEANPVAGDGYQTAEQGYVRKAIQINDQTQALTDQDLARVMEEGRSLTLFQLFQVQKESSGSAADQDLTGDNKWLSAKKQLLEIQLHMSAQANLKLMKQGIHIELEPLDQLLKLYEQEESVYHATEFADVSEKTREIKAMPAAVLGISVQEAWMARGVFTLERVHETGKSMVQVYAKAGETYEALMTSPRADLGDSIQTAFRNVDDLLDEASMEVTDDNRRAVRILGYNQMEINEENMDAVKEADEMLQKVLSGLRPEKTLRMIREGVNPLEMNLKELSDYLEKDGSESEDMEKYSRYLYRLEKNEEITQEEREAYIGIYRLLRQIEKGDDAAIGTVVSNGQELNLENLLSAVRTRKTGYVDAKIDDAFGLLADIERKGTSISEQIGNFYRQKAGRLADDLSSGEETEQSVTEEELESFRSMGQIPEEHFRALISDGIPVTVNNLLAEEALISRRDLFGKLAGMTKDAAKEKRFSEKAGQIKDAMSEGEEAVKKAYGEMTDEAGETVENSVLESGSYIDVRSMAFYARQIELLGRHAEQENYYVPVQFDEEWRMLHVRIVNGSGQGKVSVDYKGNDRGEGKAAATFVVKEDHVEGLVGVSMTEDVEKFTKIAAKCAEEILAETGKKADITCIQNETMNLEAFMAMDPEERQTSAKELYQVAKAFIRTMEQEVTENESQL